MSIEPPEPYEEGQLNWEEFEKWLRLNSLEYSKVYHERYYATFTHELDEDGLKVLIMVMARSLHETKKAMMNMAMNTALPPFVVKPKE